MQTKNILEKTGSHKEVTILLVGTGVPDGPFAQDLICRKQIVNPDRFFMVCRGYVMVPNDI